MQRHEGHLRDKVPADPPVTAADQPTQAPSDHGGPIEGADQEA